VVSDVEEEVAGGTEAPAAADEVEAAEVEEAGPEFSEEFEPPEEEEKGEEEEG